jgi:lysophospholipase L1-like esterase
MSTPLEYSLLCLGDSYTIGESVEEKERFPIQAIDLLAKYGATFKQPVIIAKTGWTTDELSSAIKESGLSGTFDYVTLLIGVNNQYRGRDVEEYRLQFDELLNTALAYTNGRPDHVFVLSIPDWGVTPFVINDAKHRTAEQIGNEVDAFNAVNKQQALKANVHYIDINPFSKEAKFKPELIATDGLHPSGKMYAEWARLLVNAMKDVIK